MDNEQILPNVSPPKKRKYVQRTGPRSVKQKKPRELTKGALRFHEHIPVSVRRRDTVGVLEVPPGIVLFHDDVNTAHSMTTGLHGSSAETIPMDEGVDAAGLPFYSKSTHLCSLRPAQDPVTGHTETTGYTIVMKCPHKSSGVNPEVTVRVFLTSLDKRDGFAATPGSPDVFLSPMGFHQVVLDVPASPSSFIQARVAFLPGPGSHGVAIAIQESSATVKFANSNCAVFDVIQHANPAAGTADPEGMVILKVKASQGTGRRGNSSGGSFATWGNTLRVAALPAPASTAFSLGMITTVSGITVPRTPVSPHVDRLPFASPVAKKNTSPFAKKYASPLSTPIHQNTPVNFLSTPRQHASVLFGSPHPIGSPSPLGLERYSDLPVARLASQFAEVDQVAKCVFCDEDLDDSHSCVYKLMLLAISPASGSDEETARFLTTMANDDATKKTALDNSAAEFFAAMRLVAGNRLSTLETHPGNKAGVLKKRLAELCHVAICLEYGTETELPRDRQRLLHVLCATTSLLISEDPSVGQQAHENLRRYVLAMRDSGQSPTWNLPAYPGVAR